MTAKIEMSGLQVNMPVKYIRAYAYVRVSTNKQLDNTSIEQQIEAIEKYCKENNIILVKIYVEEPASGESFSNRPEFKEMFYNVFQKENNIDSIIVFKQDRISRNSLDSQYIFSRLKKANKNLISIADNIDTNDPNSKLIYQILGIIAEVEKDLIAFRTSLGMEKTFENGDFNGGMVFGYNLINKKLVIDEDEARVVKYIFDCYSNKMWGYRKIASNLNMQGIKTKKDNHWSITAVRTILNNKIYNGYVKWKGKYKKGNHYPIISEELWERTQKLLSLRSYTQEKIHNGSFPLSGILKCPTCGGAMVQGNANKKYKYYVCGRFKNSGSKACKSNLVKKEYAEQEVLSQVMNYLNDLNLSVPLQRVVIDNLKNELEPIEEELNLLEKNLTELKREKQDLLQLYTKRIIDIDTLSEEMKRVQNQESEQKEFITLLTRQVELKNNNDLLPVIKRIANDFNSFYNLLDDYDRKELLRFLIKEIQVNTGEKPRDRTIKNIVYEFDQELFEEISHELI
ncbi:recombinase family protein [Oceanobacillus sp. J11TS1]|uniref:recombinase family protein n=1 Tax=Oceanobacillus sp. J11TS1 TaxID=2807191 RepID=UPI001B189615|nr:recombinase family protein [Oceanobacillus sp. J11TS1]GIO22308.1 recombinase RecB [Oceanobacillus sp. J11TS1]